MPFLLILIEEEIAVALVTIFVILPVIGKLFVAPREENHK